MHASQISCMFNLEKFNMWNFNFGQSIWDKSVVLLGTWREPLGNLMRTYLAKKKNLTKKPILLPTQKKKIVPSSL